MGWGRAVIALGAGDWWSVVTVQPPDQAAYGELAVRVQAAGLARMTARAWSAGLWPVTRCSVTVQDGRLTQLHTGRSRLLCPQQRPVSPIWQEAADRGLVALALVGPGTWPAATLEGEKGSHEQRRLMDAASAGGILLGGLAHLRGDPEPYGHRW